MKNSKIFIKTINKILKWRIMIIKIFSDVYNISNRIKNIEKNYYIVFNTSKNKFEVHNSQQKGGSYCLTLPFLYLDERTLNFVNETKSENINRILNKIDLQNKLIESAENSSTLNRFEEEVERNLNKE